MTLRKPLAIVVGSLISVGAVALAIPVAAIAGTTYSYTVNSNADTHAASPGNGVCADSSGHCTIRAAVEQADALPSGSTIDVSVPAGKYHLTLGRLSLTHNTLVVTGAGGNKTIVSGTGAFPLVTVAAKTTSTFNRLELTGGGSTSGIGGALINAGHTSLGAVVITANSSATTGGGITNKAGAWLSLASCRVTSNSAGNAPADSQPGYSGGGIENSGGALSLTATTITGNSAGNGGFGAADTGGDGANGGGVDNHGALVVRAGLISGNTAGTGGPGENELGGSGGSGGGIFSSGGRVTLTNATVTSNAAGYAGANLTGDGTGTAGNGGGVYSRDPLTVSGSTFSSNSGGWGTASTDGGAIYATGTVTISGTTFTSNTAGPGLYGPSGNGGAIASMGTLTLTDSTLSKNVAGSGAAQSGATGGAGGGLFVGAGSAAVTGDTFAGNSAGNGGSAPYVDPGGAFGGVGGDGGGIYSVAALTVVNSTLNGNTVGTGGANSQPYVGYAPNGVGGGLVTNGGAASLHYSTVANNYDGLNNLAGSLTLSGTIVADSTSGPNCAGTISEAGGHNLDSGTTCGFSASTDITGREPLLGALASNGGPTQTQALTTGSPAIDAGATTSTGCPSTDQRGVTRPDEAADNGACDIGAYES